MGPSRSVTSEGFDGVDAGGAAGGEGDCYEGCDCDGGGGEGEDT